MVRDPGVGGSNPLPPTNSKGLIGTHTLLDTHLSMEAAWRRREVGHYARTSLLVATGQGDF
jgi:hypothetical protein